MTEHRRIQEVLRSAVGQIDADARPRDIVLLWTGEGDWSASPLNAARAGSDDPGSKARIAACLRELADDLEAQP